MIVARLRERFHELHEVKGALAVLGDRTLVAKRAEVYPVVIALLVEALCEAAPPKEPRSVVALLHFVHRELAHEPDLAAQLYAAICEATVRHLQPELFRFITAARDPRGVPLLRGGSTTDGWVDAVVALRATELLDEVIDALDDEPTRELAAAVAIVGGEARRADLERRPDGAGASAHAARAVGLALLGSPDDKAFFAELGIVPDLTTARRIHTALAARGPKQRMDALDELSAGVADAAAPFGAERLLAFTLAIGDRRPDVAERAAATLAAYAKTRRAAPRLLHHALFLERAGQAVAAGVTEAARAYLEITRATIPRAAPFGAAQIVAPPPSRTAAARARGKEMVESLQATLAPTADGPSAERRDPALEAVIAANPDDREAYLVYADWLQRVGDARGAWITLQAQGSLAAREASTAFLAEHRAALLGPLAPYVAPADGGDDAPLELEWFMGFVRRATFRAAPAGAGRKAVRAATDTALRALTALLDATCGAFVQELVFGDATAERAVLELLLARRPQTLTRLAFGTVDAAPPELVQAIPRLARDPRARWTDALARLAEERAIKLELEPGDLPRLEPAAPGIEGDPATVLAGIKHESGLGKPLGLVAAIREAFTRESADRLALALAEAWARRGHIDRLRWAFAAAGPLGGDATARWLGHQLARLGSSERESDALVYLVQIGTDAAIEQLASAAFAPATHPRIRAAARVSLEAIAQRRQLGLDALLARAAPSDDDAGRTIQRAWLESLMIEARALPAADLQAAVRAYPLRLAAAATLLWAERDGDAIAVLLRMDASGNLVRRGDAPYAPARPVGLAHPAELADDELAAAQRAVGSVEQAILQLDRPVFALSAAEASVTELARFARRRVGFDPIAATLRARGWHVSASDIEDDDGEDRWVGTRAFARDFARDDVQIYATLGDTRGAIARVTAYGTSGPQRRFDELHVVTISELLWDLETAHGRPADARPPRTSPAPSEARPRSAPPARPAPASPPIAAPPPAPAPADATESAPIVERAKSGRSRCVVCGAAIAKDALRIGISRMIETPTFRGHATVWLHPACRDGAPELEGIDLDAALSQ